MNVLEELVVRGVLKDKSVGVEDFILKNKVNIYCGVDPTGDSLHVGHLVPIITLMRLKNVCVNNIYLLIGGATGMIGDPSFKSFERVFLEKSEIDRNVCCICDQVKSLFNMHNCDVNIVNNSEWYSKMNVIDFLREGKYMTVNYMSSKESVKRRISDGISFTEFSYQLLQAYDFYYLNSKFNVNVQLGGGDQWGNVTSGIDFIRKKNGNQVHGITTRLLVKSNGCKFGKTEGGCVWLDKKKTSPYEFFQFWVNIPDDEIIEVTKMFSLRDISSIDTDISKQVGNKCRSVLQRELAKEMTSFIHGDSEMKKCLEISDILFGSRDFECFRSIEDIVDNLKYIRNVHVSRSKLSECVSCYDFLCTACLNSFFESKSDISRSIASNSVFINKIKVRSREEAFNKDILNYDFILVQKGKKNYFIVFLE